MRHVALLILAAALGTTGAGRLDEKLSRDQQVLQVLNRLTFGPRPGDVERVRRIGLEKWIEQQLHPEQIEENPVLAERLKPLETLRMDSAEIVKRFPQTPPALTPRMTPPQAFPGYQAGAPLGLLRS